MSKHLSIWSPTDATNDHLILEATIAASNEAHREYDAKLRDLEIAFRAEANKLRSAFLDAQREIFAQ